jgi:hypothetical protein
VLDLGHQSHVSGLLVQPILTAAGPDGGYWPFAAPFAARLAISAPIFHGDLDRLLGHASRKSLDAVRADATRAFANATKDARCCGEENARSGMYSPMLGSIQRITQPASETD